MSDEKITPEEKYEQYKRVLASGSKGANLTYENIFEDPNQKPPTEGEIDRLLKEWWDSFSPEQRWIATATQRGNLMRFSSIYDKPLLPVDWLVEDLIAWGDRSLVIGNWASYKTWLCLHLGLHLAAGKDWLGRFTIKKPVSVLYIDEEMNPRTLQRRIKRLAQGSGIDDRKIPFAALSRQGVRFNEQKLEWLLSLLNFAKFRPQVVFVDSLRRVTEGNMNDDEMVNEFWQNTDILHRAGMTTIVLHHAKRPKSKNTKAHELYRGSSDLMAGADSVLVLQREEGSEWVTLTSTKSREGEEIAPFDARMVDDRDDNTSPVQWLTQGEETEEDETEVKRAEAAMLEVFLSEPKKVIETKTLRAACEKEGINWDGAGKRALSSFYRVKRGHYLQERPERRKKGAKGARK